MGGWVIDGLLMDGRMDGWVNTSRKGRLGAGQLDAIPELVHLTELAYANKYNSSVLIGQKLQVCILVFIVR